MIAPMRKAPTIQLLLSIILLTWSSNAAAAGHKKSESSDAGSEAALMRRGLDLRQKGQDEAALQEFRRAYELSKTGHALAQIALAEQALGRWLEAESHLIEALTRRESWIGKNKKHLDQALNDIQGHLGSLELPGEAKAGTVKVDGVQMATLPLTAPLRVPAGSVALEVQAPGYLPIIRNVVVPARGLAREHLAFVAVPVAKTLPPVILPPQIAGGPATTEVVAAKPVAARPTWGPGRTVGVILGVAALGALGTGAAFHVLHENRAKSYKSNGCESDNPPADCKSQYDSIHLDGYIAIVGYAGGAVLAGLATYLLVRSPSPSTDQVAAAATGFRFQCSPAAGLGVTCAGRF
jgi:hypothetical protein